MYCQLMAQYNEWMNGKVYRVCESISEAELRKDCGAYFKSIYLTLNHIAYADMAFLSRFTHDPPVAYPTRAIGSTAPDLVHHAHSRLVDMPAHLRQQS